MHRFIPDPNPAATPPDPSHADAIRRWTRELLKLDDEATIVVTDLSCADAGCPVVETTVAIFAPGKQTRRFKFSRPKFAVTRLMLQQVLK